MPNFYTNVARKGSNILFRGNINGRSVMRKIKYKPTMYLPDPNGEYKSLYGGNLSPVELDTMGESREFTERYKGMENFKVHGNTNHVVAFINDMFPGKIEFDSSKINIVSFDIEYDSETGYCEPHQATKEIISLSYKSTQSSTYYLLGLKPFSASAMEKLAQEHTDIDPENICYMQMESEAAILKRFVELWTGNYPDIVTGWNVEFFDVEYICNRIEKVLGPDYVKRLSPWNDVKTREVELKFGNKAYTKNILGVSVIDYMDAFKKFGYKYGTQASYKLDHIAFNVLGRAKVDYSEYGSLAKLYKKNPELFLIYNLVDTRLVEQLEEETNLLELVMTVAYGGGVNFSDAFGTVGIWEAILYRKLISENIVPPVKEGPGQSTHRIAGGYVHDPKPGLYEWVITLDAASLYPHIMLQYNMSPETFIRGPLESVNAAMVLRGDYQNNDPNVSVAANGAKFDNTTRGVIPTIIEELYAERKAVKKEMLRIEGDMEVSPNDMALKRKANQLHNKQMSIKIMMNSLFGATANKYFLYFIEDMAEAITLSGQLTIKWAMKHANEILNMYNENVEPKDYILYSDTDSIFVSMADTVKSKYGTSEVSRKDAEQFLDKFCSKYFEPYFKIVYDNLSKTMGAYENKMVFEREKICDKIILLAPKRYIASVLNSEGIHYETPKIAMTGVEAVRSSTPQACRDRMKSIFTTMLREGEEATQEAISAFKSEFSKMSPGDIGKTSGTDSIEKFREGNSYKKGTPIHYRGAILYNERLKKLGLDRDYQTIKSGDKVKFVYLKMPNPIKENIISFMDDLPRELKLHQYIDYTTQFEKVFAKPINDVMERIGWSMEKKTTLDSFFG